MRAHGWHVGTRGAYGSSRRGVFLFAPWHAQPHQQGATVLHFDAQAGMLNVRYIAPRAAADRNPGPANSSGDAAVGALPQLPAHSGGTLTQNRQISRMVARKAWPHLRQRVSLVPSRGVGWQD